MFEEANVSPGEMQRWMHEVGGGVDKRILNEYIKRFRESRRRTQPLSNKHRHRNHLLHHLHHGNQQELSLNTGRLGRK